MGNVFFAEKAVTIITAALYLLLDDVTFCFY